MHSGLAVRVPLTNSSITDAVFEVETATTAEEVNAMMVAASEGDLKGILRVSHHLLDILVVF
jgi:glyceraldehyde 3-phosphate dehydrogenase